jgi:hypothetical protein
LFNVVVVVVGGGGGGGSGGGRHHWKGPINHCHFMHSVDRNTLIAPPTGHCDGARGLSTFQCHMRSEGGCGCLPTCPQCKHGELFLRGESSSFAFLRARTQAVLSLTRHLILLHYLAPFPRANPNLLCRAMCKLTRSDLLAVLILADSKFNNGKWWGCSNFSLGCKYRATYRPRRSSTSAPAFAAAASASASAGPAGGAGRPSFAEWNPGHRLKAGLEVLKRQLASSGSASQVKPTPTPPQNAVQDKSPKPAAVVSPTTPKPPVPPSLVTQVGGDSDDDDDDVFLLEAEAVVLGGGAVATSVGAEKPTVASLGASTLPPTSTRAGSVPRKARR